MAKKRTTGRDSNESSRQVTLMATHNALNFVKDFIIIQLQIATVTLCAVCAYPLIMQLVWSTQNNNIVGGGGGVTHNHTILSSSILESYTGPKTCGVSSI